MDGDNRDHSCYEQQTYSKNNNNYYYYRILPNLVIILYFLSSVPNTCFSEYRQHHHVRILPLENSTDFLMSKEKVSLWNKYYSQQRQIRHQRDYHEKRLYITTTQIQSQKPAQEEKKEDDKRKRRSNLEMEDTAADSPNFDSKSDSGNASTVDDRKESMSPFDFFKSQQKPQLQQQLQEDFLHGYWVMVAQAKVMALAVETLPRFEGSSQIMNPASCRLEDDTKACFQFTSTCAEEKANQLLANLTSQNRNATREEVPMYMEYIWQECGIIRHQSNQNYENGALHSPPPSPPQAKFHCNSHKNNEITETHFRMEYSLEQDHKTDNLRLPANISSEMIPRYFVIEVGNGNGNWYFPFKAVQAFWLFGFKVKTHEQIQIRVTAVSPKYVYPPVTSPLVRIYGASQLTIREPIDLHVVNISLDNSAATPSPSALLRWQSGSGLNASCTSDIFYMDDELMKEEKKEADDAFWVKLDNLHFGRNYSIKVIEKFGWLLEADAHSSLHVPSCLELRGFSFELCPPPPPTNIRMENNTDNSFWIVWTPPKYVTSSNRILHYTLTVDWINTPTNPITTASTTPTVTGGYVQISKISSFAPPTSIVRPFQNRKIFSGNVPGNVTTIEIKNITQYTQLKGQFKVSIFAVGPAGHSPMLRDVVRFKGPPVGNWPPPEILFLLFSVFCVFFVVSVLCFWKRFREKIRRKKERQEKFDNYDRNESFQLQQICRDRDATRWEIECCSLTLGDAIGQGNFGLVRRATFNHNGRKMTVAVKTLRDGVNDKDAVEKLWEEFEILQNLDPHVHVVGLKGIVTKHVTMPLLVVEYCEGGDLQSHLRKILQGSSNRRKCSEPRSALSSSSSSCADFNSTENRGNAPRVQTNSVYFLKQEMESDTSSPSPTSSSANSTHLSVVDLISYARQIACGMEHLSTNKIVHRDLAARNILISGKSRVLKISDFGLSRDVYETNWYKKSSNDEIPIKWLAIECIINEIYTTKSDVWSYGILLWEIFTYGGNPYPGVNNVKVFDLLKEGYRMPRPDACPEDMYKLMRLCWDDDQNERPDFHRIRLILEDIVEKMTQVTYANMEPGKRNIGKNASDTYFSKNSGDSGFDEGDSEFRGCIGDKKPKLPPRNKK